MARLLYNNQGGNLGASLSSGGTTITFAVAPNFATITGTDYIPIALDPGTASFEVVWLTAYTAGQTTGTIARAKEDSTHWPAVSHLSTGTWVTAPTVLDGGSKYFTNWTASPGAIASSGSLTTTFGSIVFPAPCIVSLHIIASIQYAGFQAVALYCYIDGVQTTVGGVTAIQSHPTAGDQYMIIAEGTSTLTAASHSFAAFWSVGGGGSSITPLNVYAEAEVKQWV